MIPVLIKLVNSPAVLTAGQCVRASIDRASFLVESVAVAGLVVLFMVASACRFDLTTIAHELGSFFTHYAKASSALRHPVDLIAAMTFAVLTAFVMLLRVAKARASFEAFPIKIEGSRP